MRRFLRSRDPGTLCRSEFTLTFEEVAQLAGVPLGHSFLRHKKELMPLGWQVKKISMKQQTVAFERLTGEGA